MAKSFNKTREHYHVPLLLVLINFFAVALVYYMHGYFSLALPLQDLLKTMATLVALAATVSSLITQRKRLTEFSYFISTLCIAFLFLG